MIGCINLTSLTPRRYHCKYIFYLEIYHCQLLNNGSWIQVSAKPVLVQKTLFPSGNFGRPKACIFTFRNSSGSSGWVRGGRETWNLCGRLWQPSFLWPIFTGPGGPWPPRPPPDPLLRKWCVGSKALSDILKTLQCKRNIKLLWILHKIWF